MYGDRPKVAMLARINAILDLGLGLSGDAKSRYLHSVPRLLPYWRRRYVHFPIYDGEGFPIMGNQPIDTTYRLAPNYNLVRSLVRSARNLVHLCHSYGDRLTLT